jgi:thiol-disulfide isomerase/thioredoxin
MSALEALFTPLRTREFVVSTKGRSRMRIDRAAGLKIMLLAFVITFPLNAFTFPQRMTPKLSAPSLDGLRAKNFKVKTLDGKRVELNTLLGQGKPVVLNIWATWCGPCRREIPHLVDFAKKYSKDGLIVLGLTYEDYKDKNVKAVKDFISETSINYEVAFTPVSLYYFFNKGDYAISIPQTFVFHSNGTMVEKVVGLDVKAVENAISIALQPAN